MLPNFRVLMASAVSVLALSACNPTESSKAAAATKTAATVNGTAIAENRVEALARQRAAQGRPDSPELRKEIIEHLSVQFLLSQEATQKGLDKTPDVADQLDLAHQSILANAFVQD